MVGSRVPRDRNRILTMRSFSHKEQENVEKQKQDANRPRGYGSTVTTIVSARCKPGDRPHGRDRKRGFVAIFGKISIKSLGTAVNL